MDHPVKPGPPPGKQCMCYKSEAATLVSHIQSKIQEGQKYSGFVVFNYPVQQRNTKIFNAFLKKTQNNKNEAM